MGGAMNNDAWVLALGVFLGALSSWPVALAMMHREKQGAPDPEMMRRIHSAWVEDATELHPATMEKWHVMEPKG